MDYKYKSLEKYLSSDASFLNEVTGEYSLKDKLGDRKKIEITENFCKEMQKLYDFALNDVTSFFKDPNDINEMKKILKNKINESFNDVK